MSAVYTLGQRAALMQLGLLKVGEKANPLIQGTEVDTAASEDPPKAPEAPVWPPPPNATSGTVLNPKVAAAEPEGYQPATGWKRCETCSYYQYGMCTEYGVGVRPEYVCISWKSKS